MNQFRFLSFNSARVILARSEAVRAEPNAASVSALVLFSAP
jgi:hypothetical protein